MNGTQKQVEWAEDLRQKFVSIVGELMRETRLLTEKHQPEQMDVFFKVEDAVQDYMLEVCGNEDAKFWIDNYRQVDKWQVREELAPVFKRVEREIKGDERFTPDMVAERDALIEIRSHISADIDVSDHVPTTTSAALNWAFQQTISHKPAGDNEEHNNRAARYLTDATGLDPIPAAKLVREFLQRKGQLRADMEDVWIEDNGAVREFMKEIEL